MRDKFVPPARLWNDVLVALVLLTRLPVLQPHWPQDGKTAQSAWAYPIAGLVVAVLACGIAAVMTFVNISPPLVAASVLIGMIVMTGAMHEDGLADCADGFWGGWTQERRLEIMKDSRIGVYGMLALVAAFILRWTALTQLIVMGWLWAALIPVAMLSRAIMVCVMADLPNARREGLSASTGKPSYGTALMGLGLALTVAIFTLGYIVLGIAIVGAVSGIACRVIAKTKISGQTGDVLGATQQITETAMLIALTALL